MITKYKQWLISLFLAFSLFTSSIVQVYGAQVNNGAVYSIETNTLANWPQGPDTYSETAVLMDAETGLILYNKGMHEKRYPASITKIMTAMLALEHCTLDEQVTFTETCLPDQEAGSGNIGMQVGEVLTMEQCLMAVMIRSANDVATQVGEHVAGSVSAFVDMMNAKAQELGCTNTNFANASGMPDDNHYSTAYDMALIFREAIKNETFLSIISTQNYTIPPTNLNSESRTFSCHHALMAQSAPEYYEGCIGGKTGVTNAARNTLVTGVTRDNTTLIAVAMRADAGQVAADHIQLFDYGFQNFSRTEVEGGSVLLPNGVGTNALVVEELDSAEYLLRNYYYNDFYVGCGKIYPPETTPELTPTPTVEVPEVTSVPMEETEPENSGMIRWIIIGLIGLIALETVCMIVSFTLKRKKRKRKRK